jgi:DNA-binding LacI/PurR family transcriptional regulator
MEDDGAPEKTPKHARIYNDLKQSLKEGNLLEGDRIPTEHALANKYGVSRPTVTKALNRLKKEGLITRRIGSGSYVSPINVPAGQHKLVGLIIPNLGKGEIFEPICAQIAALSEENDFSLLWGGTTSSSMPLHSDYEKAIKRFIKNGVSGVFFAPMELTPEFQNINIRIAAMLDEANIHVVLLDTDYVPFNRRSLHDLVGIDNLHGGYIAAEHLLRKGFDRVDFVFRPHSSYTLLLRRIGFQTALQDYGAACEGDQIHCGNPGDQEFVQVEILDRGARNIVCGNDETASTLMRTLDALGTRVPEEVRLVGFDDIYYAHNLRVPLTTVHIPSKDLGTLAVRTLMDRFEHPLRPPVTVSLQGTLIVRESCGTAKAKP